MNAPDTDDYPISGKACEDMLQAIAEAHGEFFASALEGASAIDITETLLTNAPALARLMVGYVVVAAARKSCILAKQAEIIERDEKENA